MVSPLAPIVDTRFLSKPPAFDCKVENFSGWKFLAVNYHSLVNDANPELLEIVAGDLHPYGIGADDGMTQLGRTLYAILTSLFVDCRGEPLNMARMVPNRNGWELWRQLIREFEPQNESRGLGLFDEILSPDFKSDMSDLGMTLRIVGRKPISSAHIVAEQAI
jgi:hypothetical protein